VAQPRAVLATGPQRASAAHMLSGCWAAEPSGPPSRAGCPGRGGGTASARLGSGLLGRWPIFIPALLGRRRVQCVRRPRAISSAGLPSGQKDSDVFLFILLFLEAIMLNYVKL
jgi:hypothetical protein